MRSSACSGAILGAGSVHLVYNDLTLSSCSTEDDVHARRIDCNYVSQWQSFLNHGIPAAT